jgi:porin
MIQAKIRTPIARVPTIGVRGRQSRRLRALLKTGSALSTLVLLNAGAATSSARAADASPVAAPAPTFSLSDLFAPSRTTLLGDAGGLRPALAKYGITLSLVEQSEVLGNVSGGTKRNADYEGLTTGTLQIDTAKAFNWQGGLFNASAFQIHGESLSANTLDNLQTVSGIAAQPTTRLWELWFQQTLGNTGYDVKIGQQSIDNEFMVSANSLLFLNTMMGWPLVPSDDLYAGGPAYPLSSLGIRLRGQVIPNVTGLLGVFNDNPPGGSFDDDSQLRGAEKYGLRFNFNTGALIIGELQYALNPPPSDPKATSTGLPGTYKIGFWYDTAKFPDQRYDTDGNLRAVTGGDPRLDSGNFSIYAVGDQVIWQPDPSGPRALSVFARLMGAPGDRNYIDFSVNAGITLKAPFQGRDNDTVGLGFGVGNVSSGYRAYASDYAAVNSGYNPVPTTETFIEATYQLQIAPWWTLQPDFQYIFNPGGGIANPVNPLEKLQDEAVFGARTTITF